MVMRRLRILHISPVCRRFWKGKREGVENTDRTSTSALNKALDHMNTLTLWHAWVGAKATAGGAKEPGEIRSAILCIAPEVIGGSAANVIAEGNVAV